MVEQIDPSPLMETGQHQELLQPFNFQKGWTSVFMNSDDEGMFLGNVTNVHLLRTNSWPL